jgi:adenylate cyclase
MARHYFTARHQRWVVKLLLPLAVALIIMFITQDNIIKLGVIKRLELATIDYRFQARGVDQTIKDSSDVVIVEISDDSFKSLPSRWPWPRSYYAHLIRNLKAAGAKVVALDLMLVGDDIYSRRNDDDLRAAIREAGNVVLAGKTDVVSDMYMRTSTKENFGNIFFGVDSAIGIVNIRNDPDGVYRRYSPFFGTSTGEKIPSFGFAALNKWFGYSPFVTADLYPDQIIYADRAFPNYEQASFYINFYGPNRTFRHIKFADVVDDETVTTVEEAETGEEINTFTDPDYGYLHDGTFKNKIVLVGSTMPEDHDLFPAPIAGGKQVGDNLMYGVEIHANVIQNILQDKILWKQSQTKEIVEIFILTIITFLVTSLLKESKTKHPFLVELNGFLFSMAGIFGIGYASIVLFNRFDYVLAVISPMLAVLGGYVTSTAYHFVLERNQRMLIKTMFSTYVNPSVVDQLITNPEKLTLGGQREELTVLFSDIEAFTTFSQNMPPEELVAILNEYLSAMAEIIFTNDGTLDKYEGDAIMAFWGAPVPQHDHAMRACVTALKMQKALADIHEIWRHQNKPIFRMRIGINTGDMIVGNMGGRGKFNYTVIGDSVNLGSRLEGANKEYKTHVMASQRTYDKVKDQILGRELDLITVKGRSEPVTIYELIQMRDGSPDAELERFLECYSEALGLYRQQRWKSAIQLFEHALTHRANDYPTKLYIERAQLYAITSPPEDWNGVFVMTSK